MVDDEAHFFSVYRHEESSWRMILDVLTPKLNTD